MTFPRRPRSSIESSPRQTRSFSDGAILPRLYAPNSQLPVSLAWAPAKTPDPPSHLKEQTMWPDRRLLDLFKTEFPIVLAPMAGVMDADLVIAAAQGGALGSLPCALISVEKAREQINVIRQRVSAPVNMNFFCHKAVDTDPQREAGWKRRPVV